MLSLFSTIHGLRAIFSGPRKAQALRCGVKGLFQNFPLLGQKLFLICTRKSARQETGQRFGDKALPARFFLAYENGIEQRVCVLRGGKEAIRSNRCVAELMRQALRSVGLPEDCISLVQDTSHETANELMHLDGYVDVLIPRGGAGLIRAVAKEASVPVIRTGEGVCHIYIDDEADLDMGASILFNAKCSRPSVCNAVECVLVHRDVAADFWKKALPLLDEKGVELRADPEALEILGTRAVPAEDSDWDAEYDDYILAVKTAGGMDEAIDFINAHGTQHSEAIITKNYFKAQHFLDHVDAAAVYVNASTRFTDGGEFGLGAEIGISTQKMHARGPMGLEELTSCKYVIYGEGQVR